MRLERIDPDARAFRFYELALARSLLGGVLLVRRWGGIGVPRGAERSEHHPTARAARAALRRWAARKARRGYRRVRA